MYESVCGSRRCTSGNLYATGRAVTGKLGLDRSLFDREPILERNPS